MSELTLYLFVGYPGAGKTTVARIIQESTQGVHLWADFERHVMFPQPTHSKRESQELYQRLNQMTDELLAQGSCVIYDTNFNFREDRDTMRAIAAKHGAQTIIVWVTTPRDVAKQRATAESEHKDNRVWGNMTPDDFDRLSDQLQIPDADEHVIQIDGARIDETAIKLALGL